MISVLTLTYKRHHLLEEAIESFLQQNTSDCEMVIINDNLEVDYVYDHPLVNIINHKERFPSIAAKLNWGYKQCKYNYIYRLDDDDLIAPNGLYLVGNAIIEHPGFEIYRGNSHYFFEENEFKMISSNLNNGNVYTKSYLDRIEWPNKSGDEDKDITYNHNASIYTINNPTMIYRWGMNTLHISGMGKQTNEVILNYADKILDSNTKGEVILNPHFKNDYYDQIKKPL
jgi:glycosyltransferase involved in cell wall biosynthesis